MIEILFYLFATVALLCGIGVVLARNPVGSLLFMVVCLGSVAVIYVLLEAHFLAAIQVMVYAGAIMVLFLFVIMLLNLGHDYERDLRGGLAALLAIAVTGVLAAFLWQQFRVALGGEFYERFPGAESIDAMLAERGAVGVIAEPLFNQYVVPFEITGILLLVAVVGAVVLAKRIG